MYFSWDLYRQRSQSPSSLQSHYVFMAGITYLYGLWNMNMLGDSPVTMMDAHLDVQACLGTLEALSGETNVYKLLPNSFKLNMPPCSLRPLCSRLPVDIRDAQHCYPTATFWRADRKWHFLVQSQQGGIPLCRWSWVCRRACRIRHASFFPVTRPAFAPAQAGAADRVTFA